MSSTALQPRTKTMKRFTLAASLFILAFAASASAFSPGFITSLIVGVQERVDKYGGQYPLWFNRGIYIGPNVPDPTSTTTNKVTRALAPAAQTIDVASTGTLSCSDSAAITVTGAQLGDPCFVGLPATHPTNGSGSFSCVVSAADAIKLRFCNPSAGSLDPASAVYNFRVISNL